MTLPDMFRTYSIAQLLDFADSLDPNNGFRESVDDDASITRDSLADAMLVAYDDADTHAWINNPKRKQKNLMLIAAPDLLAALKMALEAPDDDRSWEDDAIAAIKKADPLWQDHYTNLPA
jgi:hypothetical protein